VTKRSILARAALAALGLLLALATAELAVRLLDIGPSFQVLHREIFRLSDDPVLGYELAPGARDGEAAINSAGFRDREFARAKPAGVFRIVAVGDSVTFGQPRKPDESWPKALERLLAERPAGPRCEVLNLGVTGYNVLQVAERLRTLGLAYEPDLVLYGYVLNDPQELSIELEALRDLRANAERRFHEELGRGALRLLSGSRLFLLLASRLDPPAPGAVEFARRRDPAYDAYQGGDRRGAYFRALHADGDDGSRLAAGLDRVAELHADGADRARLAAGLDRLAESTRAAGVPLVVALFPMLLDPRDGPYPLADVHAFVTAEARARGFEVIDLESALTSCEGCAADFLHPNAQGARAAAAAILEGLQRLGRLPAEDPVGRARTR
jgi:lysophospholipase L1-like esterase